MPVPKVHDDCGSYRMNKFLAEAAGALNILVAVVLILGGAVVGASADAMGRGAGQTGMVMGALGGAILSVLVCGGLGALLALWRRRRT